MFDPNRILHVTLFINPVSQILTEERGGSRKGSLVGDKSPVSLYLEEVM